VEKTLKRLVLLGVVALCVLAATITYTTNYRRVRELRNRESSLLEQLGEYQQRETARIRAERERAERAEATINEYQQRETARIRAERERIERTEDAIRELRDSDRRASSLLQELATEVNILADYFRDSCSQYIDSDNNQEVTFGSGN
jgi:DNA repair exonuclease SbcCD ATPase subunit